MNPGVIEKLRLEDRRTSQSPGHPLAMLAQEIAGWLEDVADALDFIHSQNYIHRDIKPGNILFDAHGNVFLSDFGVAKAIADDASTPGASRLTGTGLVLGTPDYMAPEVVLGKPCDGRADQYALAVMLFELLSGRLPFVGPNPTSVLVAHSTQPVPDLRKVCPNVSASIAAVIHRGLAKEPADRYPTCKALALAYRAAIRSMAAGAVETVVRQHCPVCRQVLRIAEKAAGQCVPCPGCKTRLQISADRQEIAVANAPVAVPSAVAPAEQRERPTEPVRSVTVPTAQPLPFLLPGKSLSRRRLVLGACAGSAVLVALAVVAIALIGARRDTPTSRDTVAVATAAPEVKSRSPSASGVLHPRDGGVATLPRGASRGEPPKESSVQENRAEREGGEKPSDENSPLPSATPKQAEPTQPAPLESSALPASKKHQPPPLNLQVVIARKLDQQHGLKRAALPAEKNRLAHALSVWAATGQGTPEEHFVHMRLATELYETADNIQEAEKVRLLIATEFEITEATLHDSLLASLDRLSPSGDSFRGLGMPPHDGGSSSGPNARAGEPQPEEADAVAVELPTGETFHTSMFEVSSDKVDQLIENWTKGDRTIVGVVGGNEQLRILAKHHQGYASGGPFIVFSASDDLEFYVDFDDRRHKDGVLMAWDHLGQRSYLCEYSKDKKHGLCCLFDNDQLSAIGHYDWDTPTWLTIVESNRVKQHLPDAASSEAQEMWSRLSKKDEEIKQNMRDWGKQVKDEEEDVRRGRKKKLAPLKRQMMMQRINQRRDDSARDLKSRQQRAVGGR